MPVKILNDLRRETVAQLEDAILKQKNDIISSNCELNTSARKNAPQAVSGLGVLITNEAQLRACMQRLTHLKRIYLDADFFLKLTDAGNFHKEQFCVNGHMPRIYIALPFIIRKRDELFLEKLYSALDKNEVDGCLVRNPEEAGWLNAKKYQGKIAFDAGMYSFNSKAIKFHQLFADTICLPYELKLAEKKLLLENIEKGSSFEQVVYGRIPMMITANCLVKTGMKCENKPQKLMLTDRYKHQFPVENVCSHCYNIIWNCLPLSLHGDIKHYQKYLMRLQFSTESENDTGAIIDYFSGILSGNSPELPACMKDYTTGHEKRGVE